jgi:hypothetical protein
MSDYVPELPRIERERITAIGLFQDLPDGGLVHDVLGDWILTFEGCEWRFESWAVAVDFVAAGWHLTMPRRRAA